MYLLCSRFCSESFFSLYFFRYGFCVSLFLAQMTLIFKRKSSSVGKTVHFPQIYILDQLVHSEKAMVTHSSTLAWKIPWTEEPGRLQSMGVSKSRTRLSIFTFTFHFHALEEEWQPTPVFLPGESQGRGSLVGCCLWGRTESDTTEVT